MSSCLSTDHDCDLEEQNKAVNSKDAAFKQEVISNMNSYVLLKDFILKHLSAIALHNDKRRKQSGIGYSKGKDSGSSEYPYYTFFNFGKGEEIKDQVPENLYPELSRIYKNFKSDNFYSVSFTRDSTVVIYLTNPSVYDDRRIGITHTLIWENLKHVEKGQVNPLAKDTLLSGADYRVLIDCYRGI